MKHHGKPSKLGDIVPLRQAGGVLVAPRVGRLAGVSPGGVPLVVWEGGASGPVAARVLAPLDSATLEAAAARQAEVVLLFDQGLPTRPLLMGLLQPEGAQLRAVEVAAAVAPEFARVDGRRVVLTGHDEVVLTCGKASITLRRNGKVIIRGAQIESRAAGANKVRGGSVQIN